MPTNNVDASVGRPAVNDDIFKVGIPLREDGVHRLFEKRRLVQRRCDDGDFQRRRTHGTRSGDSTCPRWERKSLFCARRCSAVAYEWTLLKTPCSLTKTTST